MTDVTNITMVGRKGDGNIVVTNPLAQMDQDQALTMAAWLVALCDDGEARFNVLLDAVKST